SSCYIFVSDVHLSAHISSSHLKAFCSFLSEKAVQADALYLLGDLFDYWTGSGMLKEEGLHPVFASLRNVSESGTLIHLIPGNRDFLLGRAEAGQMGMITAAGEALDVELNGLRLFLTHGDMFCTFDAAYQRMKRVLRSPVTLALIRFIPGSLRGTLARTLRRHSAKVKKQKTVKETSLNLLSIQDVIKKGFSAVICGHVHHADDRMLPEGGR
ncbi:MAG: UDP-2,3-diacylglucosamine diphosphatase, partial [Planctomycetota bacterium]